MFLRQGWPGAWGRVGEQELATDEDTRLGAARAGRTL